MLRVENVGKEYRTGSSTVSVLRGVDFAAAAGESLAVTGPSGCGKSTLLHLIGGLDRPTSGTVEVSGERPYELDERRRARFRNRTVGFVFQDSFLLPQYTVEENVLLPTLAFGRSAPGDAERARTLLARVGLGHRVSHRPAELSGGERQRAAVARALIREPPLLLCDEPTGSLDPEAAENVAELLFELHEASERLLIVVTHNETLASRFRRRLELRSGTCTEVSREA